MVSTWFSGTGSSGGMSSFSRMRRSASVAPVRARQALEPRGIIAEIEEDGAAVFHVGIDLGKGGRGWHGGASSTGQ